LRPCSHGEAAVKIISLQCIEPGHSFIDAMPHQAGSSAQRIRIGLTGLAFAFLLVLLGSIISRSSRDDTVNNAAQVTTNEPSEPLSELGLAPGASTETNNDSNSSGK